ncbi:universal stress protein [filamentous cyanobacterium LEGE 11480]|uniref:Universal stress protein n=1 Tax=Romeriopsis navalis LEGE 11480 TaxID=2777977 RepID=A0A928Z2P5_9CYAN|nr:universal stress protein [Romeriopsis navalis]MBE9028353.1 universal stress protein [Romeriopsis navalis LEGE 11480]
MFKVVLFPVDRSPEARQAAALVLQIAQMHNSTLHILAVVEPENEAMASPDAVEALLEEAKAVFVEQGIQTQTIERSGKPAFTICDVADEIEADLIVMGSRGLGLTVEGASDSVAQKVLSLSPCPVLVVP